MTRASGIATLRLLPATLRFAETILRIYTNPLFYRHQTGPGHPESADRLDFALEGARRAGESAELIGETPIHPETDRIIAKVHSSGYARELEAACREGSRLFHSLDNPISASTSAAARAAVGTTLEAAAQIWPAATTKRAFVIARPPGHHAERERAMGFCFFNTIACVAEYLLESPAIQRVFILDWDVHHGNGTQHLFEERSDVFYTSIHRYPFYPGTGAASEIGRAKGKGFTRNIPLDAGEGDAAFLDAIDEEILPLLDEFRPDAILISAGFDAHYRDPLGGMRVTEQAYGEMTRRMVEAARTHSGGRMLSLLEGGYDPEGIAASVAEHVIALASEE
ncbi:MAG TPA: histone deacetylase [Thermoanaerobaculia bacterium]|nr:histone deacetylase [Thermoanaerobaculia bacterium]